MDAQKVHHEGRILEMAAFRRLKKCKGPEYSGPFQKPTVKKG
jgi:hypothetical protein